MTVLFLRPNLYYSCLMENITYTHSVTSAGKFSWDSVDRLLFRNKIWGIIIYDKILICQFLISSCTFTVGVQFQSGHIHFSQAFRIFLSPIVIHAGNTAHVFSNVYDRNSSAGSARCRHRSDVEPFYAIIFRCIPKFFLSFLLYLNPTLIVLNYGHYCLCY